MRLHLQFVVATRFFALAFASLGQDGDPSTCPLLAQNLQMMSNSGSFNLSEGVPVQLHDMHVLKASRDGMLDISGTWLPANWHRDGRPGYLRNSSAEEQAIYRRELQSDTIYMSFNRQRGWWMIHPSFDLGSDGTSGWAIIEAPDAEFPHQSGSLASWKVITERGVRERKVRQAPAPTPEFLLALAALVDKDGDEVIEASEASAFVFGGLSKPASPSLGQDWVAQADLNADGILTMRELAIGHMQIARHRLTRQWLQDSAVIEASLRLLGRETQRVSALRGIGDASGVSESSNSATVGNESTEPVGRDEAAFQNSPVLEAVEATWLPFKKDSRCPISDTGNAAFLWGKAFMQQYLPKMIAMS